MTQLAHRAASSAKQNIGAEVKIPRPSQLSKTTVSLDISIGIDSSQVEVAEDLGIFLHIYLPSLGDLSTKSRGVICTIPHHGQGAQCSDIDVAFGFGNAVKILNV